MKSGGIDISKAADVAFKKLSKVTHADEIQATVTDAINSIDSTVSGFVSNSRTRFNELTAVDGSLRARFFGDRAPATSSIKGETPRVLAMAAALSKSTPFTFALLAKTVKDHANS